MFHTFETSTHISPNHEDGTLTARKRRTTTVRACESCRRRKIRCNGEYPCETCQWYRKAASCHYTEPRQRQMPSRRSVERISHTLQQYRGILQKLFPSIHPDQLQGLSREKLINLISTDEPPHPLSPITSCSDEKFSSSRSDARSREEENMSEQQSSTFDNQPIKLEENNTEVLPNNISTALKEECIEITGNIPQWSSAWHIKSDSFVIPRSGWDPHPMNCWGENVPYDSYYDSASNSEEQLHRTLSGSSEYSELHVRSDSFTGAYSY